MATLCDDLVSRCLLSVFVVCDPLLRTTYFFNFVDITLIWNYSVTGSARQFSTSKTVKMIVVTVYQSVFPKTRKHTSAALGVGNSKTTLGVGRLNLNLRTFVVVYIAHHYRLCAQYYDVSSDAPHSYDFY